ncbi:MAG TPA: tRNA (adenosine(37)-N6)-threonylcarbamoyltransferase complex dimerization subunit type 1 TsaB [Rhodanobacteraceae bacterium]|nr:tRNA (adenosine(37)-N6)-threonylcarbamoyltransferase complex dimerization subunit type 1 TsaB [Rhodanobacteraceae bacterium]
MNLLALETSTECCSVALLHGDVLIDRSELAPRRHAELVLPMAEALLAEAGLARAQLDGIAVGRGPGAFTGVRLGVSVAQGLAFALNLPVVTVSSLTALAMQAPRDAAATLAVIDARMGELYACAFRFDANGFAQPLDEERVARANDLVLPEAANWNVIGSGWEAYRDALRARLPGEPGWAHGDRFPQAREVARLALPQFASGNGLPPERALPVYLRDKVALTVAERRAGLDPANQKAAG